MKPTQIGIGCALIALWSAGNPAWGAGLVAAWGINDAGQTCLPSGVNNARAAAAGALHSLALRTDGTVVGWGTEAFGSGVVPSGLSNVVAIAAGQTHSLALKADGTLTGWGDNSLGQLNIPAGLGSVRAISAGGGNGTHSLALKADGTLSAWGRYPNIAVWTPPALSNVVAISAGSSYDVAVLVEGTVVAWGEADPCHSLTNVPAGLSNVVAVAAGANRAYALRADGTVVAWGDPCGGSAYPLPPLTDIEAIADGIALKSDGTLVTWGDNTFGQTQIPAGLPRVLAIATGAYHHLAIVPEGPLQIIETPVSQGQPWGSNATFSVVATGLGPQSYQWYKDDSALIDGAKVAGAQAATLVLTTLDFIDAGSYRVVVSNALGSVKSAASLEVISPPWIVQSPTGMALRAGMGFTLRVTAQGTPPLAYQWRFNGESLPGATASSVTLSNLQPAQSGVYGVVVSNRYGQVESSGAQLSITDSPPYIVYQPRDVLVARGGRASLTVSAAGSPPLRYQWRFNGTDIPGATDSTAELLGLGYEQAGYYSVEVSNPLGEIISAKVLVNVSQVFLGSASTSTSIPTNVPPGLTNAVAVAAGDYHVMALKSDGTVAVWVSSANYQALTNIPAGLNQVAAIVAAPNYNLVLRSNGTLAAWGFSSSPVVRQLPAVSNVVALAAGGEHALALRADGSVLAWGESTEGKTNVPASVVNAVGIAAGANHSLALLGDGKVIAWGSYSAAQTNISGRWTNIIAVSAQGDRTLALRDDGTLLGMGSPQFWLPPTLTNIVAIATGTSQDVLLRGDGRMIVSPWSISVGGAPSNSWSDLGLVRAIANSGGYKPNFFVAALGDGGPVFTIPPANQTVPLSGSVRFNARAVGMQPMSYRWQFNGMDIPGATQSSLTLTGVQLTQAGAYRVVGSNPMSSVISPPAQLQVKQLAIWWSTPGRIPTNVPVDLKRVVAIAASDYHMVALQVDGTVATWANSLSTFVPTNVPPGLNNVVAVSVGANHSLALKAGGTVVAWGNAYAITNVPAGLSNVVAISAGGAFSLALKADGTVTAWGDGGSGPALSVPQGLSNVVAVSAGLNHVLALKADGTVVAWGANTYGQASVPRELTDVIAISAGPNTSVALRANGTAVNWGTGLAPASLTNIVGITAGRFQHLALRPDGTLMTWGQSTLPAGLSRVIATGNGGQNGYSVALLGDGAPAFTVQPGNQSTRLGGGVRLQARAVGTQPLHYQWWANGARLPGATSPSLVLTNAQSTDLGRYQVVVENEWGTVASRVAIVSAPVPLEKALDATNVFWNTTPWLPPPWFGQARISRDGTGAAQSGAISDGRQSVLQALVTGPGTLTFWWRVSSEEGFDFLKFYLTNSATPLAIISGETDWRRLTVEIPPGRQSLNWAYAKDTTVSEGEDAGWLDQVSFTPSGPLIVVQPASQSVTLSDTPALNVVATGSPPLSYQWFKAGAILPGATSSTLVWPQPSRRDSGDYFVRVTNPAGSTSSSNATLVVRVAQRLGMPSLQADGSVTWTSTDANGGELLPEDLAGFEAQTSGDLREWTALPNALSLSNGRLELRDTSPVPLGRRFYRVVER